MISNIQIIECSNDECEKHQMSIIERSDWVDGHGCMEFYIPETRARILENSSPYPNEDRVDVPSIIRPGTYEHFNAHKICCSFCDAGARFTSKLGRAS